MEPHRIPQKCLRWERRPGRPKMTRGRSTEYDLNKLEWSWGEAEALQPENRTLWRKRDAAFSGPDSQLERRP